MKYKVTAKNVRGEISTIVYGDTEDEAWENAKKVFGHDIYNGMVEKYPLYDDIKSELAALREENAKLRAALAPFVELYEIALKGFTPNWESSKKDDHIIFGWNMANFTIGIFRKARATLNGS